MKRISYITYNLVYQLASFFFLLYANTFVNEYAVPYDLMWKNGSRRLDASGLGGVATIKTAALLVEAAILITFIYVVNRLILTNREAKDAAIATSNRTAKIEAISSFCFIIILIWGSFRGYLW